MIEIRRLRLLAELDRLGTLTAVGAALHLTAPGVSSQLAALEREVGLTLTEKDGRRVRLTQEGKRLAAQSRVVLDQLEAIETDLSATRDGRRGVVRVGAFPSAARTIVAGMWRRLLEREPDGHSGMSSGMSGGMTLTMLEAEPDVAIPALELAELDVVVSHSYTNVPRLLPESIRAMPLVVEPVWAAVRFDDPVLRVNRPIDLAGLADRPWLLPPAGLACHQMVQRACAAAGFVPRVVAEATDFSVITALVGSGAGVALVPELTVDDIDPDVRLVPLEHPVSRHLFVLTRVAAANNPLVRSVCLELAAEASAVLGRRPRLTGTPTPPDPDR